MVTESLLQILKFYTAVQDSAESSKSISKDSQQIIISEKRSNEDVSHTRTSAAWRPLVKRCVIMLSDVRLAISELALILAMSAVGTLVEQNQSEKFYQEAFPAGSVLSYKIIFLLQLDHVYSSIPFLTLLALFAASLASCTSTNQLPAFRLARNWKFQSNVRTLSRHPVALRIPGARLIDVGQALKNNGYQVFRKDKDVYAFKGIVGKLAPIGVHASMLAALFGITVGVVSGSDGKVFVPEGQNIQLSSALQPRSLLFLPPAASKMSLRLDDFIIDFRADGSVRQFYSDVSVLDSSGSDELYHTRLRVNEPLRFGGVTAYQIDWKLSSLNLISNPSDNRNRNGAFSDKQQSSKLASNLDKLSSASMIKNLPLKALPDKSYATFLRLDDVGEDNSEGHRKRVRGITLIAEDPQLVRLYDSSGRFAGAQRPGSNVETVVDGVAVQVTSIQSASGLQLKSDPGIPWVYAGFSGICITTVLSYISHSQVWATKEDNGDVLLGGKSNRSKIGFAREIDMIVESLPNTQE